MPEPINPQQIAPQVRAMQIIVVALAMGVALFAGVVILLDSGEPAQDLHLALIAAGAGFLALVLGIAVPRQIGHGAAGVAGVGEYQTRLIVSCAIFEGAAFFNLVAYMLEGQNYSLAIALVLWVAILLQFPTVGRVTEWLESRERSARESRAFES